MVLAVKSATERANILAYLRSLSDSPEALPRPIIAPNLTKI